MTDTDQLAHLCAELLARNAWLLAEVQRLSAAVRDTAVQLPSPQEARLAWFGLHQRAAELEPIAIKDPRQVPVYRAYEAAVERFQRLTT